MTTGTSLAYGVALDERARLSLGSSHEAIYRMVGGALAAQGVSGCLLDVGCGGGGLWRVTSSLFTQYIGLDAVRYDGFPDAGGFVHVDLDADAWPDVPAGDAVVAVETIEHLENPWTFVRSLAALAKPGALVIVTTPNQLSLLSVMTLVLKQRFSAFQDSHYPAHRTALLESDLRRMFAEAGLEALGITYSLHGRLPLTPWHYPEPIARTFPRALSDNLMIVGRKPRV